MPFFYTDGMSDGDLDAWTTMAPGYESKIYRYFRLGSVFFSGDRKMIQTGEKTQNEFGEDEWIDIDYLDIMQDSCGSATVWDAPEGQVIPQAPGEPYLYAEQIGTAEIVPALLRATKTTEYIVFTSNPSVSHINRVLYEEFFYEFDPPMATLSATYGIIGSNLRRKMVTLKSGWILGNSMTGAYGGHCTFAYRSWDWMATFTNARLLKEARTWTLQDFYENLLFLMKNYTAGTAGYTTGFIKKVLAVLEKAMNSNPYITPDTASRVVSWICDDPDVGPYILIDHLGSGYTITLTKTRTNSDSGVSNPIPTDSINTDNLYSERWHK